MQWTDILTNPKWPLPIDGKYHNNCRNVGGKRDHPYCWIKPAGHRKLRKSHFHFYYLSLDECESFVKLQNVHAKVNKIWTVTWNVSNFALRIRESIVSVKTSASILFC